MKKTVLALSAFFTTLTLTGCISNTPPSSIFSHMQNGHEIYKAYCDGDWYDISHCHKEASKRCNGNFEIIQTEITPRINSYKSYNPDSTIAYSIDSSTDRIILFQCK